MQNKQKCFLKTRLDPFGGANATYISSSLRDDLPRTLFVSEIFNPELTELLKELLFLEMSVASILFESCSTSFSDEWSDGKYSLHESEKSPLFSGSKTIKIL